MNISFKTSFVYKIYEQNNLSHELSEIVFKFDIIFIDGHDFPKKSNKKSLKYFNFVDRTEVRDTEGCSSPTYGSSEATFLAVIISVFTLCLICTSESYQINPK